MFQSQTVGYPSYHYDHRRPLYSGYKSCASHCKTYTLDPRYVSGMPSNLTSSATTTTSSPSVGVISSPVPSSPATSRPLSPPSVSSPPLSKHLRRTHRRSNAVWGLEAFMPPPPPPPPPSSSQPRQSRQPGGLVP
ncbi:uncharacterized protein VTP21DRAFT_2949 [Calcarisporiella thermophila]|uniref:uncharacterized protein n=1 Tax=Calcarisporiella thermophila TaxID=911321 RepID=UPI0037438BEF